MRAITRQQFPRHRREALDKIPLVGTSYTGNPEKFFLGRLSEHRGKTVDCLIEESLTSYLDKLSYTSSNDLTYWLSILEADIDSVQRHLPKIEAMMQRRHHIVHRGDKSDTKGPGKQYARSLSAKLVQDWNTTVNVFLMEVAEQFDGKKNTSNHSAG